MSNTSLLICVSQCWPGPQAPCCLNLELATEVLQCSGLRGRLLLAMLRWRWSRALFSDLLQCSLPGIMAHYQWRKRHINAWIQQQVEQQGIEQLVIIGAGFDALGAIFSAKYKHLQVVEIDRPCTIAIKQAALHRLNALSPNLCIKGADLACCSVAELLADTAAFSANRPTLVLAEGVLMYITEPAIKTLFQQLCQSVSAPLQLVATQMQLDQQGRPQFAQQRWLADIALAISKERFVSGVVRKDLPNWLAGMGFSLQQLVPAGLPENADPCPGELLFYASALPAKPKPY